MVQISSDRLESIRLTTLYEWTLTILVSNFTIQVYRLIAQIATFFFNILKLSHGGVDYFWPLTTDDLRPYTRHMISNNDILYKLGESLLLTMISFYAIHGLLNMSIIALGINFFVFLIHVCLLLIGLICVSGSEVSIKSVVFFLWLATLVIEIATIVLTVILIAKNKLFQ